MFMDDTTLSEVIEVSDHTSGTSMGKTQENVNNVVLFAKHEKIELNVKKCKECDFRKNKTTIPPINSHSNGSFSIFSKKSNSVVIIFLRLEFVYQIQIGCSCFI
jgi:hypothetical protein